MPLLQTNGLVWQLDPRQGVREIDLSLDAGQALAVLASNRARLLTLLRLLQGQLRPEAGTVHFAGSDVTTFSPRRRLAGGLVSSLVARPQGWLASLGWRHELTLQEEVRRLRRLTPANGGPAAAPDLEQLLADFALLDYRRVPADHLPADVQPFFDLLCCSLWQPRLILVSNPFLIQGADRLALLRRILRRLCNRGVALLLADSDLEQAAQVSDRFVVLARGRPVGEGDLQDLIRCPRIREAYLFDRLAALCPSPSVPQAPAPLDVPASTPYPIGPVWTTGESAFSSLAVIVRYPAPIALAYRRFCRQPDPTTRLQMLTATAEVLLRYLVSLGLADLFACSLREGTADIPVLRGEAFEFLRGPKPMLLGLWLRALRELAEALAGQQAPFCPELPAACGSKSPLVRDVLPRLVTLRNQLAHPPGGAPPTAERNRETLLEARPLLEQALQQVQFLCSYPLGFAQRSRVPPSGGGHRYHLHSCMGASVANTGEAYSLETAVPLPTGVPFVVAPDQRGLLCLWPWLAQRVSPSSGQHTLYLFDDIPDRRKPFLSEIRWVALDGREHWREELAAPARDHGWLRDALRELPSRLGLPAELGLHARLRHFRQGQLVGHRVGAYRLLALLAVGGFGTVYAADSVPTGEHVAVKVLESPEALRHLGRFQREQAVLREAGQHPHVVRCLGSGCEVIGGREYPWYAMELAGGGDLADRIAERHPSSGGLPWDDPRSRAQIISDFQAVAAAVAHLHALGILHRDIKPANVLILADGTLRLSDFGLCRPIDPTADTGYTSTGAVLGTRDYMAVEQARGEDLDARADVYSLGVLLAELATGQRPRPNSSVAGGSTLGGFAPLRQLPDELGRIVRRCTDVDPQRRPADGQAVLDLFTRFAAGAGTGA